MLQAAAEAIDRPGHDHVELATGRRLMKGVELRPLVFCFCPGDTMVLLNPNDLPTGPLGDLTQFSLLVCRGLIEGRNPEIEDCSLH